ncbi:hypothetical protein DITRI_Ditri14bG0016100 [Diplodiscus trichospermus]
MASMSLIASLLPTSSSTLTRLPSTTARRGLVVAKAARVDQGDEKGSWEMKQGSSSNGRRELIFAAAVTAACSVANMAMGQEEPKRGTPEAKKKYAPVCVTMPTARICRK